MPRLVFRNGSVFDGHRHLGPRAVVVEEGRVAALLPEDEAPTGPDVETVDLAGGLLAPGFVDAHVHAVMGGLERIRCDLSALSGRDAYVARVASYAAEHPDADWVQGGGWTLASFPGGTPLAADLDAAVPDRPVFLPNRDHHGAWVNTRALEIAGIDTTTPDPPDGRIERDVEGRPTGMLHEGAMALVARHLPATTDAEHDAAFREAQRHLHGLGVTGWQDALLGEYAGASDPGPTYLRAARRGDLTAWVVGALWWERDRGEEQVEDLVARREAFTHGRLRATSIKVMQDGVPENGTASMLEPYLDLDGRPTANRGHSFVDGALLPGYVSRLSAEGFQVHVHAIGDRAVREALDAFEAAAADPRSVPDLRHHVAHIQVIHPDDVPRFGRLGVAANMQALWACNEEQMTELTLPFLGGERGGWQYPFADLHRTGARLVAGSDWPVTTPDPLQAIHTAVNRTTWADDGTAGREPFLPAQALDLATAMAAYTSGSAWVNHRDDAGTVTPGAVTDLVVLDHDPFAGPPEEIGACRVTSTWVDGVAVHRS